VSQRLGDDRAEHDHDADLAERDPKALLEGVDEVVALDAGENAKQQDRQQQRQEDVPLPAGDQQHQQNDTSRKADQRENDVGRDGDRGVHV
jgi:hypothetical protein